MQEKIQLQERVQLKERIYKMERENLSPYASLSEKTRGRRAPISPCPIRTEFTRDRDRIIHSKAFRRLKHKTQVFLSPEGDHYRTRLTHTLEVGQIARTISRSLMLNEDLTEAIALGHDLGHTPFGHAGERVLSRLTDGYFEHNIQSLRVVDLLESETHVFDVGLNLTYEVRDGILNHRISGTPATLEGKVVSYADRIAYINHDIDDGIRAGILNEAALPTQCTNILGHTKKERINRMIDDLITNSADKDYVRPSDTINNATLELRQFLFDNFYIDSTAKSEEQKAERIVEFFFNYYMRDPSQLPEQYHPLLAKFETYVVVCDYIASMTDRYLVSKYQDMVLPSNWKL